MSEQNFKPKVIYRRNEIPIADHLMTFQDALRADFMKNYGSLEEAIGRQAMPALSRENISDNDADYLIQTKDKDSDEYKSNLASWKAVNIKYEHRDLNIKLTSSARHLERFPTAAKLLQEFGDEDCPILNYSCLAPRSVIHRHTGIENRLGEFVRIHIPLIVPKGDIFFEVYGEEVDWSDLFAFNNQFVHSAHNLTDEYRLVFLLDLRRSVVGLPPGEPYNEKYELEAPAFVRK